MTMQEIIRSRNRAELLPKSVEAHRIFSETHITESDNVADNCGTNRISAPQITTRVNID